MTTYYVDSGVAAGDGSGNSWTNAVTSVTLALGKPTPTLIYVAHDHSHTAGAAITWTLPAGDIAIICVTNGTTTWATGATEAVGAASAVFNITPNNTISNLFCYGMVITGGTNNNSACSVAVGNAGCLQGWFKSCSFVIPSVHYSCVINFGSGASGSIRGNDIHCEDCTFKPHNTATSPSITVGAAHVRFTNMILDWHANRPNVLFSHVDARYTGGSATIVDSDLSGLTTAGTSLVAVGSLTAKIQFRNCKLSSTTTATSGTFNTSLMGGSVSLINCDQGDTLNVFEYYDRTGTLTEVSAADSPGIYKDSGASYNSSGVSWKIVTTSVCSPSSPFRVPSLYRWNTSTASTNFKVDFIVNSAGTALTDQEIWLEVGYPSSTSTPIYTHVHDRNDNPITGGSPPDQTSSSATWTGATTPTKQYCDVTATPLEVGMIEGVVYVGKETTIYLDPQLQIT